MVVKITNDNFEEEVLKSDKPVLLDFWADWCGPCKMMSPVVEELADELEGQVKVGKVRKLFEQRVAGDIALAEAYKKQTGKRGFFNQQYLYENKVSYTLTTHADSIIPFKQPIYLSRSEVCNISTFPQDYHFLNQSPHYICGMSVPPVMMAHVASRIWKYWLSKL